MSYNSSIGFTACSITERDPVWWVFKSSSKAWTSVKQACIVY